MQIVVLPTGRVQFIHDDELAGLMRGNGSMTIRRASHVEPTTDGQWTADMEPVGGPVLGPFETRAEALVVERVWLREHRNL